MFLCHRKLSEEIYDHKCAKDYSVDTERLEAMLLHKAHKELYNDERHEEGYNDTNRKKRELEACGSEALHNELKHLKSRCAKHYGNCKEEGEFRRRGSGYAAEHTAEDGRARTRSAGDKRKHLICADNKRILVGDVVNALNAVFLTLFELFYKDKGYAVNKECNSNYNKVVKMLVKEVVEQKTEHLSVK